MSSEATCPITLTVAGDPRLARLVRMTAAKCFQSLVESLRADIIILILVNFPVSRRPGNGRSVHLSFLGFCHAGCFVRGDLGFAKA